MGNHDRIAREMGDPALIRLHRKLGRLSSVLTVMNTGAHPDDEANGLLAALRFGLGLRVIVACSTRGEGGQNALGPERGGALGMVRTMEMEAAARVIDADVVWLGHGPDDPIHDFGFSKNGDDTLARWGEDRIVERLVRAYREERPDIVIPTFLDVPGQHGHHRAMTRAAETALDRAADPNAYPHHRNEGLQPWRVAKFYLPAWSGGGATYDDETSPPPATLTVTPTTDAATGAPFARIGEWSRAAHLTQGMGVWLDNPARQWLLHGHRGDAIMSGTEPDIRSGLSADVGALGSIDGMSAAAATLLKSAQRAIEAAQAAFPHREAIVESALNAADAIETTLGILPDPMREQIEHRLRRKLRELDAVILEARGVRARAWADQTFVSPGDSCTLHVALETADTKAWAKPVAGAGVTVAAGTAVDGRQDFTLAISRDAAVSLLYPPRYRALGGNGDVTLVVGTEIGGRTIRTTIDLEEPLRIVPEHQVEIEPAVVILPLSATPGAVEATVTQSAGSAIAPVSVAGPEGWHVELGENRIRLTPPEDLQAGRAVFDVSVGGAPAVQATPVAYPHIDQGLYLEPASLTCLALDLTLPDRAEIGYVAGGSDRVAPWMRAMGLSVTTLDENGLSRDLSRFSTLVIGTLAFSTRPRLAQAAGHLRRYVEAGGHLVTLYQRPLKGWDPEATPPRPIVIGSPSLRWRVTNPAAPVSVLDPDSPLLVGPNRIGPADWEGWDKERGIYFASRWDAAYRPVVAISDAGEAPLQGGLLSGIIGAGRHTHVSLVLHHQLDRLVPGAFRLLANLVQAADELAGRP
ncbi:PIG-L family deacetylase [Microvirga antarctica]|uniref:PIG-L family deacetylase n=1 Tax=Microvirga antarctica TaxID=2819233 RepID=UPI003CCE82C9